MSSNYLLTQKNYGEGKETSLLFPFPGSEHANEEDLLLHNQIIGRIFTKNSIRRAINTFDSKNTLNLPKLPGYLLRKEIELEIQCRKE